MDAKPSPFIFFLTLGDSLSNSFYSFDRIFRDLGFILVPVQFDQLQSLMASSDQSQVIVISAVSDIDDTKTFALKKTYSFLKFPIDARVLSSQIARFYEERTTKSTRWPGGTRSGVKSLAV